MVHNRKLPDLSFEGNHITNEPDTLCYNTACAASGRRTSLMPLPQRTKTAILLFAFVSLAYFLCARGSMEISDTYFSVQTAKAIVTNHSLSAEGCRGGYCLKSEKDGKYYSKFGLGLAFLLTPYVLLGKVASALTHLPEESVTYFLLSFYNIFFGAGACVVMFFLVRFFGGTGPAALRMSLLLGFATFCWRYSIWDFSDVTQMFFLSLAVYGVLRGDPKSLSWAALSFCGLLLIKAIFAIYLPVFVFYIWTRHKSCAGDALKHTALFRSEERRVGKEC